MRSGIVRLLSAAAAFLLFISVLPLFATNVHAAPEPALITTSEDLVAAIAAAKEGDTILVGDITFRPMPSGAIVVPTGITLKSGKDGNAVFTDATLMIKGSTTSAEITSFSFENIDFKGQYAGKAYDPANPPEISSQLPAVMKTQTAAILQGNARVAFRSCSFEGYHYGYGGAISAAYSYDDVLHLTLENCVFRNNVGSFGGAVYLVSADRNVQADIVGCKFMNNGAQRGGAVFASKARLTFRFCTFSDQFIVDKGYESPDGGALSLNYCSADIDASVFCRNETKGSGGAISSLITHILTLNMRNCSVYDNKASKGGSIAISTDNLNFDSKPYANLTFCSLIGNEGDGDLLTPNARLLACTVVEKETVPADPSAENGYCLFETFDSSALPQTDAPYAILHPSSPLDRSALEELGLNADPLLPLQTGNNYCGEKLTVTLKCPNGDKTVEVPYGECLELPEPTRRGYRFTGWKTEDGTPYEGGGCYLGGYGDLVFVSEWKWCISDHLWVIWIPLASLVLIGAAILTIVLVRKKKAEPAPEKETDAKADTDWIRRVIDDPEVKEKVTKRELDVLELLLMGKSRAEIASELYVTESTVKKHSTNIYVKFGVRGKPELISKLANR